LRRLSGARRRRYPIQSGAQCFDKLFASGLVNASVIVQTISKVLRQIDVRSEVVNRGTESPHDGAIVESPARLEIENTPQRGELQCLRSWLSLQG
jgi:hypothetical protein